MNVCHLCASLRKPKEVDRSPGARIIGGCRLSLWVPGTELESSGRADVLLTTEPSLNPQFTKLYIVSE